MAGPLRQCVVASRNPVKVEAAQRAIDRVFPTGLFARAEGVAAPSGVSDQPFSDAETLAGARNRVASLRPSHPDALILAVEGGVRFDEQKNLECFAWCIADAGGPFPEGKARSASFLLPKEVADLVAGGMELGDADDIVFSREGSKRGNGAVGLLTNDIVTRTDYYVQPFILSLIPLMQPALYPAEGGEGGP